MSGLPLLEGFTLEPHAAHRQSNHPHKVLTIVVALVLFQTLAYVGIVAVVFA